MTSSVDIRRRRHDQTADTAASSSPQQAEKSNEDELLNAQDDGEEKKHEDIDLSTPDRPVCTCSASSLFASKYVIIAAVVVVLFGVSLNIGFTKFTRRVDFVKYNDVLADALSYKWFHLDRFFGNETIRLFQDYAFNEEPFSTIVEEKSVDSAGEAVPIGHPHCKHPYMTLNVNRTLCHFSSRLDVGMHFLKTGGFNGHIEFFDRMVTRILVFRKRLLQHSTLPISNLNRLNSPFKKLSEFNTPDFLSKAKSVCLENELLNDPSGKLLSTNPNKIINELFQLDLVLLLPGQEMPTHLNVPYFWGADRNTLPQWLLVTMKNSKLFDHLFIPQVQGLLWLTLDDILSGSQEKEPLVQEALPGDEDDKDEYVDKFGEGGDFYLYPYLSETKKSQQKGLKSVFESSDVTNKYVILKPKENSAILLDGAQVIHGLDRFKPDYMPPLFAASHHYSIKYDKSAQKWRLHDSANNHLASYYKNDVKLMIVWNMHCFASETQRNNFKSQSNVKQLTIEEIMATFKKDLKAKDKLPSDDIEPIDLWTIALKEYLKYPVNTMNQNSTNFGVNYCLLPHILPNWLAELLKPILNSVC